MKTLKRTVLPILTGLLFVDSALWSLQQFTFFSILFICAYLFLAVALFRRRREWPLTAGAAVLILARWFHFNRIRTFDYGDELQEFVPLWAMISGIYLAGIVLLLAVILVHVVGKLKKYRPYINPIWFIPGLVMLAGIILYGVRLAPLYDVSAVQGILSGINSLNRVGTPPAEAVAVLLIPLWLRFCAPDDLKPYEDMLGELFTQEQLEEKRRELGLAKK